MKFVIAGALGHIGSKLIRELSQKFPNPEIIMIDNMRAQRYCSLFDLPDNANYQFIENDILDIQLADLLSNADVMIQLAAITNAAGSFEMQQEVEYNNFNTTSQIAQACLEKNVPLIHLSSTSIYGSQNDTVDELCTAEDLNPQSPYAATKLREEQHLQQLGSEGLNFVTCRFGTICGISPGMRFHTAVNKFCWQAVTGQPLTVWSTALHQKRPYLSLTDAMAALVFIIKNKIYDRQLYNVLTDNLTVNDIIEFIKKYCHRVDIKFVDSEIMNQLSYNVSRKRFEAKNFTFSGSIENDIKDTVNLLKNSNSSNS
jgi:UDP-glucose 4-epimerase